MRLTRCFESGFAVFCFVLWRMREEASWFIYSSHQAMMILARMENRLQGVRRLCMEEVQYISSLISMNYL